MERQRLLIGGLFGTVHTRPDAQAQITGGAANHAERRRSVAPKPGLAITPPAYPYDVDSMARSSSITSLGAEAQSLTEFGDDSIQMLPDLATTMDVILPMSPRTLLFDSFDKSIPLYSTMDASLLQVTNDMIS
jgi:hypothetical protein